MTPRLNSHVDTQKVSHQRKPLVYWIHGAEFKVAAFYVVSALMTYIMCNVCSFVMT